MISICIPIYNFDVTQLVRELHHQAILLGVPFQILLIDDASKDEFRTPNKSLATLQYVDYFQLEKNLGRTGIRNLLAERASYPYLLFMDCDSKIKHGDYLKRYLPFCNSGIICSGGREYLEKPQDKRLIFHWTVGVKKEVVDAETRAKTPNKSFMSCNFLIDKKIFRTVKFDERLKGYCNEDTLFGIELDRNGIRIQHIDNPLYHIGLEPAEEFLTKIENGLRNLHKIDRILDHDALFINSVTVMRAYSKLKKHKLAPFVAFSFLILRNAVKRNLLGKHPNMKLFDYYKMGYLCLVRNWANE